MTNGYNMDIIEVKADWVGNGQPYFETFYSELSGAIEKAKDDYCGDTDAKQLNIALLKDVDTEQYYFAVELMEDRGDWRIGSLYCNAEEAESLDETDVVLNLESMGAIDFIKDGEIVGEKR